MIAARLGPVAAGVVLVALLAGCGSDDTTSGPQTSSSPATSASPLESSGAPTSTPTTAPTTETTSDPTGPAAATGQVVELSNIQVNAPAEWGPQPAQPGPDVVTLNSDGSLYSLGLTQVVDLGASDLDTVAASFNRLSTYSTKQKVLPNAEWAGQEWFHLAGQTGDVLWAEDYGTFVGNTLVVVGLETQSARVTRQERNAALDSIMASVVLKP